VRGDEVRDPFLGGSARTPPPKGPRFKVVRGRFRT